MKTAIVMPVANEEATIENFLTDVLRQPVPDLVVLPIMDNYSKDKTQSIIETMQQKDSRIRLLFHDKSTGNVSCYLFGFEKALEMGFDYIIEMDSGGSHESFRIPKFVELLNEGNDCVFSTRFSAGGGFRTHPLKRRLISRWGTWLANFVLGTKLSDMTSGFEAFRRPVLQAIKDQIGFQNILSLKSPPFIQTEIRYYCSEMKFAETPIIYTGSTSIFKYKTVLKSLVSLFKLLARRPVVVIS